MANIIRSYDGIVTSKLIGEGQTLIAPVDVLDTYETYVPRTSSDLIKEIEELKKLVADLAVAKEEKK